MRKIKSEQIVEQVKKLCIEASLYLGEDVLSCIKEKAKSEKSEVGKNILNILVENAEIAKEKDLWIIADEVYREFVVTALTSTFTD